MNEIWVSIILTLVSGVIVPVLLAWLKLLLAKSESVKNSNIAGAVFEAVSVAVNSVNQTLVADIKAKATDGKLSKQEAQAALNQAVKQVEEILPAQVHKYLESNVVDMREYLIAQIEARIGAGK